MTHLEAPVGVLAPPVTEEHYLRFGIRYAGLVASLDDYGITPFFTHSHTSYDPELDQFTGIYDVDHQPLVDEASGEAYEAASTGVLRDLTMAPATKPLYDGTSRSRLVHAPEANQTIRDKGKVYTALRELHPVTLLLESTSIAEALDAEVLAHSPLLVIKPTIGSVSNGIHIGTREELATLQLPPEARYMAQEFIKTSDGIPNIVEGMHNMRGISIGGKLIGAIARMAGTSHQHMLKDDDFYGHFAEIDTLPEDMQRILRAAQAWTKTLPGDGNNVLAIDCMYGTNQRGERRSYLGEINYRPLRISGWNTHEMNPKRVEGGYAGGIQEIAKRWDRAEAAMLAGLARAGATLLPHALSKEQMLH